MFDRGRTTRFDLCGHALIHTAPNVRKVEPTDLFPAGYSPICIGTTTSARMERFTRPLMDQYGVRIIIGKGGLSDGSQAAFTELGGVYLAIIGGTAALETTWVEAIEDVDLDDLNPESLWKFRVRGFGPLLVGMDSHGGSLYREVATEADFVLIMSVNPGFGGQIFIPRSVTKVSLAKALLQAAGSAAEIEVDGGVDRGNAGTLVRAGATMLVAGASIFGTQDPAAATRDLRNAADTAA